MTDDDKEGGFTPSGKRPFMWRYPVIWPGLGFIAVFAALFTLLGLAILK